MRKLVLSIQCKIVEFLVNRRIIKDVWYKCELDLAKIRGKELYEFLRECDKENRAN